MSVQVELVTQQPVPALTTHVLHTETLHASPIPTVKTAFVIVQIQASTVPALSARFTPPHVVLKTQNY
jgi:hypothetical protein